MSDQKISISTRLFLQWQIREQLQSAEQLDFTNAPVIQLLEVLESHAIVKIAGQSNSSDITRLESKVDLLLGLFTRNQFKQQYSDVPNFEVTLSADKLVFNTNNLLKVAQFIEMEVFFNQNSPEPLLLSGEVAAVDDDGGVVINFCELGKLTQGFLEKYIFKLHRSEIAKIRGG
jgi:hypothetical protein